MKRNFRGIRLLSLAGAICISASVHVDGVAQGGGLREDLFRAGTAGFDDAVADSVSGFSATQGASRWEYGVWQKLDADGYDPSMLRSLDLYAGDEWRIEGRVLPAITATSFKADASFVPVRRWKPYRDGSVRLVGWLQKPSPAAGGVISVYADGDLVWSRTMAPADTIPHAFDIAVKDLKTTSEVDVMVVPHDEADAVVVHWAAEIIEEPYLSSWRVDLPTGIPLFSEEQKATQRAEGQRVLELIREASRSGASRLIIPPGDYRFHADWSRASTLQDIRNLEIVAKGVTFWFEPPHVHGLLFRDCSNVTVRGLTIDFDPLPWFQARITEIDRDAKRITATVMQDYLPRNSGGELETSGRRACMFYDAAGNFVVHTHNPSDWRLLDDGGTMVIDVRLIPAALETGGYVVGTLRTGAALRAQGCEGMLFEDINIWSSPGMAVNESGGAGGNVYRRVRATRRPHANRLHAFGADVFHLSSSDKGPTLDRCESAYGADDNLNIHGRFGRVRHRVGPMRYHLQGSYQPGDRISFYDDHSVDMLGEAVVVSVVPQPEGPPIVELDTELELPENAKVVMARQSAAGFVVRNSWFHNNFQRTMINGAPGGLIENNTLQQVGHGLRVQFETWGPWMEGPFASDLVVRRNRFLTTPGIGANISVSMHPPGGGTNVRPRAAMPVKNMTIEDNYFSTPAGYAISVHNVDGLVVRGNVVDRPWPKSPSEASEHKWLYLQTVNDAVVEDNEIYGLE